MKPWQYKAKPLTPEADKQPFITKNDATETLLLPWEEEGVYTTDPLVGKAREARPGFQTPKSKSPVDDDVTPSNTILEPVPFRNRSETYRNAAQVLLPLKMLESLMTWTSYYHELRIQHPDGLTLNATPEHVRDAINLHPWGTIYITDDVGRFLVACWGEVPTHALMELRDLETEARLVPEQVAA